MTAISSHDGGLHFAPMHAPPKHLVAALPYQYVRDQKMYGYFAPSNIVTGPDGALYSLIYTTKYREQAHGLCLIRTETPLVPSSWRAWDGRSGFTIAFRSPYQEPYIPAGDEAKYVCTPVVGGFQDIARGLVYSTYYKRYMKIGSARGNVVFALSTNLTHWSEPYVLRALRKNPPEAYPTVIDPSCTTGVMTL